MKAELYRTLASKYGYTPNEIAELTLAQQYVLISEESTGVLHFNSEAEMANFYAGKRTK